MSRKPTSTSPPGSPIQRFISLLWYGTVVPYWLGLLSFIDEAIHKVKKFDYEDVPKRTGQLAVITGGSRGIGFDVLRKLLQLNYHVILGVRSIEAGNKAVESLRKSGIRSGTTQCLLLDLKSLQSVREFAKTILAENESINVLINNAGIMCVPYELTEDGFETHFQVNYLSHFLLTQLLLPKLKVGGNNERNCSRIINVSSVAHFGSRIQNIQEVANPKVYTKFRAYADSKLCQVLLTKDLDAKLRSENANVRVYAVHPGIIPTGLYNQMGAVEQFMNILAKVYRSSDDGAEVIMYAVLSRDIESTGGCYIHNSRIAKSSTFSENLELQRSLWKWSQGWVEPHVKNLHQNAK